MNVSGKLHDPVAVEIFQLETPTAVALILGVTDEVKITVKILNSVGLYSH